MYLDYGCRTRNENYGIIKLLHLHLLWLWRRGSIGLGLDTVPNCLGHYTWTRYFTDLESGILILTPLGEDRRQDEKIPNRLGNSTQTGYFTDFESSWDAHTDTIGIGYETRRQCPRPSGTFNASWIS